MYRRNILIRIRLLIIQNATTTYLNIQHSHFENFLIVFDKWSIALINYLLLIAKYIYNTKYLQYVKTCRRKQCQEFRYENLGSCRKSSLPYFIIHHAETAITGILWSLFFTKQKCKMETIYVQFFLKCIAKMFILIIITTMLKKIVKLIQNFKKVLMEFMRFCPEARLAPSQVQ